MRKIYLFLTLMLVSIGVNAQTMPTISNAPTNGIWDPNTKFYTIKYVSGQTNYYLNGDITTTDGHLTFNGSTAEPDDDGLWCIVGDSENGYSFYNYGSGNMLVMAQDGTAEASSYGVLRSTPNSGEEYKFDFVASNKSGYWSIKVHGSEKSYWTAHGAYNKKLAYWYSNQAVQGWNNGNEWTDNRGSGDDGSAFIFSPVEVNLSPLFEDGKLYRIKNRCMNLSVSKNTLGNGNGAYLSSTFVETKEYNANIRDIHCATTSKADAGCIWRFEGNDTDGWAIKNMNNGMYIDDQRGEGNNGNAYLYVKFVEGIENAARFTIAKNSDGYFTFLDSDYGVSAGNYLHASGAGLQVYNATEPASHWEIIPATELEVTLNGGQTEDDASTYANWASLYLPFAVEMPSGVTANKASVSAEAGTVTLESMLGDIPANTGMILRSEGTTTNATLTILSESEISDLANVDNNALSGTNVDIALDGTSNAEYYVLGKDKTNGRVGLRNPSSSVSKIPMNKAYYHTQTPQMNMLMFVMGEATGIDHVKDTTTNNAGDIYDLSGRKVVKMLKGGIYIQNGKKFFAK